jgi:hypothetical protein
LGCKISSSAIPLISPYPRPLTLCGARARAHTHTHTHTRARARAHIYTYIIACAHAREQMHIQHCRERARGLCARPKCKCIGRYPHLCLPLTNWAISLVSYSACDFCTSSAISCTFFTASVRANRVFMRISRSPCIRHGVLRSGVALPALLRDLQTYLGGR